MSKVNIPTNFNDAVKFLNGRKEKVVPGIRGTRIKVIDDNTVSLYYHTTPVVTWDNSNNTKLNSGGHRTVTTKARINMAISNRGYVYQRNGDWYFHDCNGNITNPFYDGITV